MKLLVIGLDGMTFDVINPLIELGHLPNIARLMDEGAHSVLLSTVPSITSVAWSSFIAGKSPGDHGVYVRGSRRQTSGILIAWGQMIEAGARLQEPPHIWDIAPTLLSLAEVPIPTDMTGRTIIELMKRQYREYHHSVLTNAEERNLHREDALWTSEEDEQLVRERLQGLGYLE